MRTRCHASLLVVVALIVTAGCRSDGAGDDNFYRAEAAFRTCVEKHGAGVEALEIKGDGVAKLVYDEDTPPSLYDKVARKCETLILPMLQSGGAEPSPSEAPSEGAGLPPVPPSVETVADYVTQLQRTGFDGAVLIGTEEAVSDGAGLGFADPAGKLPNTTDTVFDVGSVAKMFTAVAVLEAIERGRLAYDAKLGDLLPAAPPDKTEITVQQLLTHRSGLGEYHDTEGDFERMTRARATKVILSHDLAFEPGSNRAYSNSGYTLLAIILERVLSEPFTAAVTRMFDLLQMSQTGFYGSDRLKDEQVAVGHENRSHGSNRPDQWQPTWALLGAGGIASSVEDLHRWITGVHSGRLLAPDSVQDLYDEVLTNTPQILPGERIVGYAGANDFGFETTVVELLDSGQHVIVSSNSNAPDGAVSTEAALVLAQLLQQ